MGQRADEDGAEHAGAQEAHIIQFPAGRGRRRLRIAAWLRSFRRGSALETAPANEPSAGLRVYRTPADPEPKGGKAAG